MVNPWMTHMKTTLAKMRADGSYKKGDGLKKVIMAAKKTYKKTRRVGRRGGAGEAKPMDKMPVIEEKDEKKPEEEEDEKKEEPESESDEELEPTQDATPLSDDEKGGRRRGRKSKSKKKASRRTRRKLRR